MRKILIVLIAGMISLALSSCSTYLCPTYSKAAHPVPKDIRS